MPHKLPRLGMPHELALKLKQAYIKTKREKGETTNLERIYSLDLLNLLQSLPPEKKLLFSLPRVGGITNQLLYSIASGDLIAEIKPISVDEEDSNESLTENRLKALKPIEAGMLIFLIENIRYREYRGHDSKRTAGWFYTSGSDLVNILEQELAISEENTMRDEERFVYLCELYHYINETVDDDLCYALAKKEKKDLLKDVALAMRRVKERDEKRVKTLLQAKPQLFMLQECIKQLNKEYKLANSSRWFTNPKRNLACEFIDLVKTNDADTYLGLIVFIIMYIKDEYKFLSPEGGWITNGSDLYKRYKPVLALNLNEMPYNTRIDYLRALSTHVARAKNHPDLSKEKADIYEYFLPKIDHYVDKLQRLKQQPSLVARCVSSGVNHTTQYTVGYFAATSAIPLVGTMVAGSVTGPVGWACSAAAGTILMTELGKLALANMLPDAVLCVYGWLLEKIGSKVGDTTANLLSTGYGGLKSLLGRAKLKSDDIEFIENYINALLTAPDSVVEPIEKRRLSMIFTKDSDVDEQALAEKPKLKQH